ncbi:helix-turn-helix domain-containing protein [Streptomyces sp. NBC_01244]|uniref:helix-turn-helix domain-containing protein n=1 Tax=Streptomyces sp. NBC_01244 TaxID=2903797 RepID=UPI002E126221|nr:helix-turn-helix domain-containing protein [Streptomyces sp. NBC_01244]
MPGRGHRVPEQPVFGRRLRELRVARGLSQAELVGAELSAAYLSRLESGARPPTERVLALLCARLDVSPSEFLAPVSSPLAQALATVATVGESPQAATLLEDALLRDGEGDAVLRWHVQWLLARSYQAQGREADELRVLRALVALSDQIDLPDLQARSQVRLARRLRASGQLNEARTAAGHALNWATEYKLPFRDVAEATLTMISIDAETGQLGDARTRADQLIHALSEDFAGPLTDQIPTRLQVEVLWTAAGVAVRQGDRTGTAELLRAALERMPSNDDPVLWMRLRLAAASMYLQMDPRDTVCARRTLDEAASAAALVGMPLHQLEVLLLQCQLAFHEGRFADARELSDRLGPQPEGMSRRDHVALEILRNQLAIVDGDRAGAQAAMERIAKEARESGNVELSAEAWRALAESLSAANGTTPG